MRKFTFLFSFVILACSYANAQLGQLWGVTSAGGTNNGGVLYFFDAGSGKDSIVYNFPAGATPQGTPMQANDGMIYGVTQNGGSSSNGSIYQYNPVTATFTTKASFAGGAGGANPLGTLIQSTYDGNIYGTTQVGGSANYGTIFQYKISTGLINILYSFNGGALGNNPFSGVVEGASGTLYGTTYNGGANTKGTLYRYVISSSIFTSLYSFANVSGTLPSGVPFFASDGNLYGMTTSGGAGGYGVIYKWTIAGSTYTQIATLSPATTGTNPEGSFVGSGSTLYGLAYSGGTGSNGTIISCTTSGVTNTLYNFSGATDGKNPMGNFCFATDGNLYGVTNAGGSVGTGIMFKTNTAGTSYTSLFSFTGPNGKNPDFNSSVTEVMSVNIKPNETGCTTQTLVAMVRGEVGATTYNWSTGATTSSITATAANTYSVTVTDGRGIVVSNSITLPAYTALSASATGSSVSCYGGNNGTAISSVTGGYPPYSFSWSNGGITNSISNLIAANYTYTVTDNGGCTATATYTVSQPAAALGVTLSGANTICNGSSSIITSTVTGGTAPDSYTWGPATGLSSTTTPNVTAIPSSSMTYTVTVTDVNGCIATQAFPLTVNPLPTVTASAAPGTICSGSSSVLNGSGASTYTWAPNTGLSATTGVSVSASPGSTQTYTVTGTNAAGCSNTATQVVTVNALPNVTVSGTTTICSGNNTTLTASGANTYSWNTGATNASITVSPASTITYTVTGTITATGCLSNTAQVVTVNANPTVSALAAPTTICSGSSSVLSASGASTYTWAPNAALSATTGSSVTASPASSKTYTVTGTNAAGCAATATVPLTVNITPTISATSNSPVCSGSTLNLTGSGGGITTWSWSGPNSYSATLQSPSIASVPVAATGTYTITGTTAAGCSKSGTTVVTVNALPTVTTSATPSTICSGNSSNLTASGASTYTWAPNTNLNTTSGSSVTASPTSSLTYTVTGTSVAGCSSNAAQVILVNPSPSVMATSTNTSCFGGNDGSATANPSSGTPPYTYSWSPTGGTNITASGLTTGTYTVSLTDNKGCTFNATTVVGQPTQVTVSTGGALTVCSGSGTGLSATANGGTPSYTYNWMPGNLNGAGQPINPVSSTTYTVTATDAKGCTGNATQVVTVNALPTVTIGGTTSICPGNSTTLTASGANTYSWAGGPATANYLVAPGSTTTYTVTGTAVNGCTANASQVVTVNSLPAVSITGPGTTCSGSTITITGNGADTYVWSGGPATVNYNVSPTSTTTYTVTGTNTVTSCSNTSTHVVTVNALPTVTASASSPTICFGGNTNMSASGAVTYAWSPVTSLNTFTGAAVNATPTVNTTYTVTGTDGNGCQASKNIAVTVDAPTAAIQITNASCFGSCNGTGIANVSGGSSPYTYNWSNGQTSNIAYGMCQGSYTLTLKDVLGCSNSQPFSISQPAAINVTASSNATTCGLANGTATANPSGGTTPYNYSWNTTPVQNVITANNLASGNYTVTVTDGSGCTASKNISVGASSGPAITVSSITPSTCGVANGKAAITVSGGVTPYSYSWNTGDTLSKDSLLAAGTYIVTVADNNKCSTFDAITISDGTGPSISVTSVTEVSCNGAASGAITVNVTGGSSPYHYSWSNSATTSSISGLTAGPYQITVTDVDSCTAVQTINITQPTLLTASTNITQASCGSSDGAVSVTVSGGTMPYLYAWNTGATTSGINSIGIGTYSITITDKNGCTNSMQASISNSTGPLVTLDSVVDIGCAAGTAGKIIITANGGTPPYTYLWSNGSTTANISGLAAGNYALTVTDAGGCAGTANATITQAQLSPISICMATVDPATNYNNLLWDPSGAIPRISHYNIYKETTAPGVFGKIGSAPAGTGIYVDTLSDARKRSWRYELSQVDSCGNESPLSAPFKTMHLTINLGASNSINLIWDNFQGVTFNYYIVYRDSVPGIASDSIDYVTNNGIFTYTDYPPLGKSLYYHMGIDGSAGCTPSMERGHRAEALNYNSSKSNTGNITVGGSLTGVQDISPATNLYIYPNPSRGVFNMNFHLSKQESVVVKIFNPLGQVIEEMDYGKLDGKVMKQFDLSNYGMGMYIIEVKSEDGVEYRKVTVQ